MTMSETIIEDFQTLFGRELFQLVVGTKINEGFARTVYECNFWPEAVVKFEHRSHSFQNAMEWETWHAHKEVEDIAKWLAPIRCISPCGTILIQERTTPIEKNRFPPKIPSFLTDTKRSNFGMYKGRVVCHDYGFTISNFSTRLKKAEWWDE